MNSEVDRNGSNPDKVDVLFFGAHPDDVEIAAGGLILKLHDQGYETAIVDMTAGEMGSGSTTDDTRLIESEEAGKILGVKSRENLGLPDCDVEDTFENRCLTAGLIRKYQPTIIFSHYFEAHPIGRGAGHNDHYKTGQIVANAHNYAHLKNLPIEGEPWYAPSIYYYMFPGLATPTFCVEFGEYYDRFLEALGAYKSVFKGLHDNIDETEKMTGANFIEIMTRAVGMLSGAGTNPTHAFYAPTSFVIDDVVALGSRSTLFSRFDELRKRQKSAVVT